MTLLLFKKHSSSIDDGERNSETRRPSKDSEEREREKSCEKSREVSSKYLNAAFFILLRYLSKKHCLLLFISSRKKQQQRGECEIDMGKCD